MWGVRTRGLLVSPPESLAGRDRTCRPPGARPPATSLQEAGGSRSLPLPPLGPPLDPLPLHPRELTGRCRGEVADAAKVGVGRIKDDGALVRSGRDRRDIEHRRSTSAQPGLAGAGRDSVVMGRIPPQRHPLESPHRHPLGHEDLGRDVVRGHRSPAEPDQLLEPCPRAGTRGMDHRHARRVPPPADARRPLAVERWPAAIGHAKAADHRDSQSGRLAALACRSPSGCRPPGHPTLHRPWPTPPHLSRLRLDAIDGELVH